MGIGEYWSAISAFVWALDFRPGWPEAQIQLGLAFLGVHHSVDAMRQCDALKATRLDLADRLSTLIEHNRR